MNELKTLKELISKLRYEKYEGKKAIGYDFYKIQEELKQEAIKWIKAIKEVQKKGDTLFKEHGKLKEDFAINIYDYEQDDSIPIIKFIKHFFNIEESDLI